MLYPNENEKNEHLDRKLGEDVSHVSKKSGAVGTVPTITRCAEETRGLSSLILLTTTTTCFEHVSMVNAWTLDKHAPLSYYYTFVHNTEYSDMR